MSWPPSGGRWSASSAVNSATSSANCTRSTASSSISKRRQPRSTGNKVKLKGGTTLSADLVVVGIGVRPRIRARRASRPRDRPRRGRERIPGDQRTGNLRRRRYRAVARSRTAGRSSGSNTGSLPSARGRPSRATSWAGASALPMSRSSGASTTTCRSTMSVMPRSGTSSRSRAISRRAIAWCAIAATASCSPSPRSTATSTASRRNWRWNAGRILILSTQIDQLVVRF